MAGKRHEPFRLAELLYHAQAHASLGVDVGLRPWHLSQAGVGCLSYFLLAVEQARPGCRAHEHLRVAGNFVLEPSLQKPEDVLWILLKARVFAEQTPPAIVRQLACLQTWKSARPSGKEMWKDDDIHVSV